MIKLRDVRLLAMDVDGVLTDGAIDYDDAGRESKRFHVQDGMGLAALRFANISVAWISGRRSEVVSRRAHELRVAYVVQGVKDKRGALQRISEELNLTREQVAFVGDDWNDLPAFDAAGVKIAVANAVEEVKRIADIITERRGGEGAIREVCYALLDARGQTAEVLSRYLISLRETPTDAIADQ